MADDYAHQTSDNAVRGTASPSPEVFATYGNDAYRTDPNLAQLLGEGETTYFLNASPSNEVALAGVIGAQVEMVLTNNGRWPLLLKAVGLTPSVHLDWVWQLQRSDGSFPLGSGWHHARNLSGVNVPLLLGNGLTVDKDNTYTLRFQNLSAVATNILAVFKALQIANPEGIPSAPTLEGQVALLDKLANRYVSWANFSPAERGLAMKMYQHGHFYTFPLQNPIVNTATDPRFAAVDLSLFPAGSRQLATFRNETGLFIWEGIVYHTTGAAVPGDPFTFEIETGSGSWKMTQGAVQSRAFFGGRNSIGQWIPIRNPKPWIIGRDTDVQVTLRAETAALPGVWFEAIGTIIGAKV